MSILRKKQTTKFNTLVATATTYHVSSTRRHYSSHSLHLNFLSFHIWKQWIDHIILSHWKDLRVLNISFKRLRGSSSLSYFHFLPLKSFHFLPESLRTAFWKGFQRSLHSLLFFLIWFWDISAQKGPVHSNGKANYLGYGV